MTIKQQLVKEVVKVIKELGISDVEPKVEYPADPSRGDYSTNVAMAVFAKIKNLHSAGSGQEKSKIKDAKTPMELAEEIRRELGIRNQELGLFEKVEVVKPGFINFWITNDALVGILTSLDSDGEAKTDLSGKKVVVEFAHPNTHKAFHIGHLRNITIGESIVRLLEAAGANVIRANYQGDVGMHIAKALYALLLISNFKSQISNLKTIDEKIDFLGKAYSSGSKAYDEDADAKAEILTINKKIYAKDPAVMELYDTTRQWSLDYFEQIYKRVGTHYDRYYFESEVYESGKENVLKGLEKGVFEKSDGAIIFPGSKYGLHDRVFITSEGNPTYEGKEMGLGPLQFEENHPEKIIHVVGPEQSGYFQVVFEALARLFPETKGKEQHLAYGWVKLKHGKMSSRSGNVVLGEWLIDEAKKEILSILDKNTSDYNKDDQNDIAEKVAVGAVKYSFLKVSTPQEIAFDLEESVSFDGNSGPYIQYVYARTQSVLTKSEILNPKPETNTKYQIQNTKYDLQPEERELLRMLAMSDEVIEEAANRFAPNIVCNYLFELSQAFNLFYQKCPIIKSEEEIRGFRLSLTSSTGKVIKKGLNLLGIEAPARM